MKLTRLLQTTVFAALLTGAAFPYPAAAQFVPAGEKAPEFTPTRWSEDPMLSEAFDLMTIGEKDAPFELVMLASFDCSVCARFEEHQLPILKEQAIDSGLLRVRFIVPPTVGKDGARYQFIAAQALLDAGIPVDEVLATLRGEELASVPQGIHLIDDESTREKAMNSVSEWGGKIDWNQLMGLHRKWSRELRVRYFDSRGGTPMFFLRATDDGLLPPDDAVYTFKGYQLADPMLEFMGVELETADETPSSENDKE